MRVRTVTAFIPLSWERQDWAMMVKDAGVLLRQAKAALEKEGYEVQTVRIATCSLQPPANYDTNSVLQHLSYLEGLCATNGVTLLAIGPFAASERNLSLIPKLLASTSISTSCSVALLPRPSRETALRVAACVMDVSRQTRGAGSFHFCVAANAPPHIPYFPVAYAADGGAPCFAVGTENDDVLFDAFQSADGDLAAAERHLSESLGSHMRRIQAACQEVAASTSGRWSFQGIDTSIAPGLDTPSMTDAYEALGLGPFGGPGTLAISELITRVVKGLPGVKQTGYSGLMLPVCEDAGLAAAAAQGAFRISDLLHWSAVCGCGLDTVPVPGPATAPGDGDGDATREQLEADAEATRAITALLLDLAATAYRLDKPLSCRLLPVPRAKAGERTAFKNQYLIDTAVMPIT